MGENRGVIDTNAIAVHEVLEAYMRAGFTRDEAFELVRIHVRAGATPSSD